MWTYCLALTHVISWVAALQNAEGQVPLNQSPEQLEASGSSSWPMLNFSSTAPYLFSSSSSLLRQWGNTFFPNGHSIVAAEVPPFTLLYHGRRDDETPPSPEWLAFDIGMSYGIMGSTRDSYMLTYQTTRAVKVVYFDGESAALMGLGQLDTQMLHIYGNVSGPPRDGWGLAQEYDRAKGLCDWLLDVGLRGKGWGYEGVVRMNAGFEVIWCDFNSPSLRLLSQLNVTAPQLPETKNVDGGDRGVEEVLDTSSDGGDGEKEYTSYFPLPPVPTNTEPSVEPSMAPAPPNWRRDGQREPFLAAQTWGWFSSATHHYGSSRSGQGQGEARARVGLCGILSYYSPSFRNLTRTRATAEQNVYNITGKGTWMGPGARGNRSTALMELARRRRYHHLENVTSLEASVMRKRSELMLKDILDGSKDCSGADWVYITNEIVQIASGKLKQIEMLLGGFPASAGNETSLRAWAARLRSESHAFSVGYLQYPTHIDATTWKPSSKLYTDTYSRCRYKYTRLTAPSEGFRPSQEERDLIRSVEEVQGDVCSVLLTIGFGAEEMWAQHFDRLPSGPPDDARHEELERSVSDWSDGIKLLVAWLGWEDRFTGCKEVCGWDERCYIPMWPLFIWKGGGDPRLLPRHTAHLNGEGMQFPAHAYPPGRRPHRPGRRPGRDPSFFGDDADLWEPKCVKSHLFGY